MNKIKKFSVLALSGLSVVSVPLVVISCGGSKHVVKSDEDMKIKSKTDAEIAAKQKQWLGNIVTELKNEKTLDKNKVASILKKHKLHVDLAHGVSGGTKGRNIGDKYGEISNKFIPAFNKLSDKDKAGLTLEAFGLLFQDTSNEKFHIGRLVNTALKIAFGEENPNYDKFSSAKGGNAKGGSTNHTAVKVDLNGGTVAEAVTPKASIVETFFAKPGDLKFQDTFWDAGAKYGEDVTLGRGKTFYKDLTKNATTGFPQFALEDWINVYDNKAADLLKDPNHVYAPGSPTEYAAKNSQFGQVYNNKPDDANAQIKTGDNNNGLNGIYSGAGFGWDNGHKTFDTTFVETMDNKPFTTSKTISNGWEHVSPQSREKFVLGEGSKQANKAIGDLHNLRPSIQDLYNGPRKNSPYGMISGDTDTAGVDFELGKSISNPNLEVTEPRVNVRGDIARIIFYMHDRYHVKYDLGYYKELSLWALMDPVTAQEKSLDDKIAAVMGFHNEYVTGEKHIPYSQEIEAKVIAANSDTTANTHTWAKAAAKHLANDIDSVAKASALDWAADKTDITFPFAKPTDDSALKGALVDKQIILKATLTADSSVHYFKISGLQSHAILAKEFTASGLGNVIKINANHGAPATTSFETLLTGDSQTPYTSLTDKISSITYKIVA